MNRGFTFQPNVYNVCYDLLMMSMNLSDIAVLNTESADYCCFISSIRQSEAMNLMQNIDFTEKKQTLQNINIYYHIQKWKKNNIC